MISWPLFKDGWTKLKAMVNGKWYLEKHFLWQMIFRKNIFYFTWNPALSPLQIEVPPLATWGRFAVILWEAFSLVISIRLFWIVAKLSNVTIPTNDPFSIIWTKYISAAWFIRKRRSSCKKNMSEQFLKSPQTLTDWWKTKLFMGHRSWQSMIIIF